MNLQPHLQNSLVKLSPLQVGDFELLFAVASDPLVWEQHPNRDRYKRDVFSTFFEGAIASGGAFRIEDASTGETIGSSRFYDLNTERKTILIGYTFFARKCWGGKFNPATKKMMIDYAFQFVDHIQFHIGASNIRSQTAIQRIGAKKVGELDLAYYGEAQNLNYIFQLDKA